MKQNKHTAKDIERYRRGELSSAEMHTLEKAALDDPFLADALEGYQHTQTATTDLASLQQRLQARIQKEEDKKRFFFIGSNWMKIAALFILFAGGGWLVFQILPGKKQELATNQTVEKQKPAEPVKDNSDSSTVYSDAPATSNTSLNQSAPVNKTKTIERKQTIPSTNVNDLVVIESPKAKNPDLPTFYPESSSFDSLQTMAAKPLETPTFKKDTYSDGLLSRSNDYSKEKREKNSENFLAKSNPSLANRKLSGRVPGIQTDTIKNVDVVLQSSQMEEDEVVVVNKNKTVARRDGKRSMQVTVDTLEPAKGWTNFGDYIATNMRAPEELETKPQRGEIELSFEVNKQGDPVNITIVRSLCEKCDEEAIRLLKEGPKWKKNKKRGRVRFSF